MMALASNTAVWQVPEDEPQFKIDVVGKQWFWEFHYTEQLTYEDVDTHIDVEWAGNMLMVHAHNTTATNVTVAIDGVETDYELNASMGMLTLMGTSLMLNFIPRSPCLTLMTTCFTHGSTCRLEPSSPLQVANT